MIVNLRELTDSSGRLSVEEDVPFEDAFGQTNPIRCHIDLAYQCSGGAYYFHGELTGVLKTSCHNCLEQTERPVTGDFDVVVRKGAQEDPGDVEGEAGEFIVLGLNEYEVSLDQFVYENLVINIPMRVVCREDCKGLCPSCGANLNVETCTCEQAVDPRWDALKKLKGSI